MTATWARDLRDAVAVVTGASRGIGRSIAQVFGDAGAQLIVAARDATDLKETTALVEAAGGEAVAVPTDVGDPDSVASLAALASDRFGRVDVLVNNAGMRQDFATVDEIDESTWQEVIDVNLTSVYRMTQAFYPLLVRAAPAAIINVASIAGPVAFAKIGAYAAAKAGVISLTKTMATEWADVGLRVNGVAPGWIESPMNAELRTDPSNREAFESIKARSLLKRFGKPEEVARLVTYLATERDGYITGEVVFVDGGWTTI